MKKSLRGQAEKALASKKKRKEDSRSQDELIHELQVHQIELEMQNDELRRTHARLEDFYLSASLGYFIFNEEWTILEANPTGARMLGATSRQPIINKPLHDFIHPEFQDTFHLYSRKVLRSAHPETCELMLKRNMYVSIESIAVLDEKGERTGKIRSIFTGITERKIVEAAFIKELALKVEEKTAKLRAEMTERKQAENLLRNEKLRLEIAQESAQAGTFEWNIQKQETIWSDQLKALYGFAPGEFKGFENWSSRVHPDDLRKSKKAILESLKTGKYDDDFRVIWPDGSLHWLSARGKVVYDEQGRPLYMTGINMDITERKRAEEIVRASTKKIETVLASITDMYVSYDKQWRFVELNPMAEKLIGKPRQELIGKVLWQMFPDLKDTEIHKNYLKAVRDKANMSFEAYSPVTRQWHEFYLYPAEDGLSVYLRDITERKQAEAALRESQEKYKAIFETSNDALMLLNKKCFIDCNSQTLKMYDFANKKEFLKNHPADLSPPIQPDGRKSFTVAMEHIQNAFARGYERFEWMHIRRNGEAFPTDVVLSPLTINNEKVLQAIVRDITELKQTEKALRESEEKFRTLADASPTAILVYRGDKYLYANPAAVTIFGGTKEELLSIDLLDIIHPDYRDIVMGWARARMKGEQKSARYEIRAITKAGEEKWLELSSRLIQYEGSPAGMAICMDITERKQAEEALQKYKDELENKVRERTSQLSEMNKSLLAEIEERKRSEQRLRRAQQKLRAMASEIVFADERTRQHFASDLHDTVVQTLGAAKLRSHLIQDSIPSEAKPIYTELQDMISRSITQSRSIMAEMSPPILYELGFIPALEWLTEQFQTQHGISMKLTASKSSQPLNHEIQVLLFQAMRELLINVIKHSKAKNVLVNVSGYIKSVKIEVIDNGSGFDKKQAFRTDISGGGFGLFSIRERLRHFGGELKIWTKPGEGTRVVMTAPRIIEK